MSIFTSSVVENIVNKGLASLFNINSLTNNTESGTVIITGKNGSVTLPVIPESYTVNVNNNNSIVNIQSLGDLNMIGKSGLRKIAFSTFLPAIDYPYAKAVDTTDYINRINSIRTSDTYCHLTITDTIVDFDVTIDSFNIEEGSGVGDINISFTFTEYKHLNADSKKTDQNTGLKERPTTALKKVTANLSYRRGDTPLTFLNRAISKTNNKGLDVNQQKYLKYAKCLVKSASDKKLAFNIGDTINLRKNQDNTLTANMKGKEVILSEAKTKG